MSGPRLRDFVSLPSLAAGGNGKYLLLSLKFKGVLGTAKKGQSIADWFCEPLSVPLLPRKGCG